MEKLTLIIENEVGLHARPAANLVSEAIKFKSEILIYKGDKHGNAKSIFNVLCLGVSKGDSIEVIANGEDEKEAIEAIKILAEANFKE